RGLVGAGAIAAMDGGGAPANAGREPLDDLAVGRVVDEARFDHRDAVGVQLPRAGPPPGDVAAFGIELTLVIPGRPRAVLAAGLPAPALDDVAARVEPHGRPSLDSVLPGLALAQLAGRNARLPHAVARVADLAALEPAVAAPSATARSALPRRVGTRRVR